MQGHSTPETINPDKDKRTIARGLGYIVTRPTKAGVARYQARWRQGVSWKSKTFGEYHEAENCLLRVSALKQAGAPVTVGEVAYEDVDFSFVYFIQAANGGLVKIGRASNPIRRLNALQSASPAPLRIIAIVGGGAKAERYLHRIFDDLRVHGEWFEPDQSLMGWIKSNATTWVKFPTRKREK